MRPQTILLLLRVRVPVTCVRTMPGEPYTTSIDRSVRVIGRQGDIGKSVYKKGRMPKCGRFRSSGEDRSFTL